MIAVLWAGPGAGAPVPAQRGELRIAMQYDRGSMDPAVLSAVTDKQMTVNVFEGLVRHALGTVKIEPALAESWTMAPDGKTWTFKLRRGVRFHKEFGEMQASDVKFSLERIQAPALKSPYSQLMASLERVEVLDRHTVRILLNSPDPAFLDKLAQSFGAIVSEKAVKARGDKFDQDPVGTGRYQFSSWAPQQETVFTPFDEYWGGRPALARVVYVPIPDSTTMFNAFEAGDVHLVQVTDPDKLKKYRQNSKMTVVETPGLITRFFGMNRLHKPFDDIKVRTAVLHAVNRTEIVQFLFGGVSTPARSILAPGVLHAEPNVMQYRFDPSRAKRLLAEAGYPNGFRTTFYVPNIDRFTRPATVIQQHLRGVGIEIEIRVMEVTSFLARLRSAEGMPMFTLSRGQDPAPDRVLYIWFHSSGIPRDNWANISIPEVDRWLDEALRTLNEDRRKELFSLAQKRIVDEAHYFFIDHENHIFAMQARVKGFVGDPQRSIRLDNVSVER
ncbi:MAG: ABC transporter substrate-binding protein [bacterium]|nr:ABC transporter substrate-binding protein [bacterium]